MKGNNNGRQLDQITLCGPCASDYRTAGIKIVLDVTVKAKDKCDKCCRMGWTYLIERKKK